MTSGLNRILDPSEVGRYILNGLLATAVHYGILNINLHYFGMKSAGLASFLAAIFSLTFAFMGSRYFVFRKHEGGIFSQARTFLVLYGLIACLHGLVLFSWADICGFDYRIGFLLATGMQAVLSYWGNKRLVFKV